MNVTTIVITDPELLARVAAAEGQIVFQGPTGETVKKAEVVPNGKLPPGFKIPFTEEELAERSKQRTGRPIGEVIRELKEKHGE